MKKIKMTANAVQALYSMGTNGIFIPINFGLVESSEIDDHYNIFSLDSHDVGYSIAMGLEYGTCEAIIDQINRTGNTEHRNLCRDFTFAYKEIPIEIYVRDKKCNYGKGITWDISNEFGKQLVKLIEPPVGVPPIQNPVEAFAYARNSGINVDIDGLVYNVHDIVTKNDKGDILIFTVGAYTDLKTEEEVVNAIKSSISEHAMNNDSFKADIIANSNIFNWGDLDLILNDFSFTTIMKKHSIVEIESKLYSNELTIRDMDENLYQ